MRKIITIIIFIVSYIGNIQAEKVKIGDLYYELDESTHTAKVSRVGENGKTESDNINIPSLITFNGVRYVVTSIRSQAFWFCSSSIVSIPNSIITISNSAFDSHYSLKSINVANDNPYYCSIDGVLFDKQRTTLIKCPSEKQGTYAIPYGVSSIGEGAFDYCKLTNITIPNSVTNIGEGAFNECLWLNSIIIPNSVKNIGERAFSNCSSLTSVTIPNSVTNIGGNAFSWSSVSSINVVNDNPYYCSIDGVLFDKQRTTLIQYPCGKHGEYIIPNNVTIEYDAFDQCWGLTSITIPTNISGLQDSGLLKAWSSLSSINVVDDNPYYSSIDGVLFDKQRTTLIKCPSEKQGTYAIPYGVSSIGEGAFDHCKLTNITIPNSVTHIGRGAFVECYGLNSIIIPNSVINIGDNAFHGVYSIEYYGSASGHPWGAESMNEYFVEESLVYSDETKTTLLACLHGATGDIVIPNSVISIRDSAFMSCYDVTSVTVPQGVATIGKSAFYGIANVIYSGEAMGSPWGATYLNAYSEGVFVFEDKYKNHVVYSPAAGRRGIAIPSDVTSIGDSAFYFSDLTSVTIPNSVISIGNYAFSGDYLTDVTIPESVQFTGKNPFNKCSWLTAVTWNAINCSTYDDGQYVYPPFQNCENITSFTIGENVEALPRGLCYGLPITHIAIPPKVRYIGTSAFRECKKLTSVIIVGDVQFGSSVFEDCPNVIVYTTNPTMSIPGVPAERVKKVTYQQLYDYPFSIFAKSFVEEEVNKWQQKGEFERITDWQKRVNEQTRQQKINDLLVDAEQKYVAHWQPQTQLNLQLGKYDADNEIYAISDAEYGDIYMPVPSREAKSFKENWEYKQFTYSLQIMDDQFKLASVSITMPYGKEYICHATDDVNYNIAKIEYNFSPIDLNIASSHGSQGSQNISMTKLRVSISDVDTNIPKTDAYNPNTFVIIFANEDYKNVASVPFAKNDGSVFQQYCQKTLGVPVSNIHYVENASFNDIRIQLAWLNDVCNAFDGNASLIVYYAGHGIPDEASKSAYLLPVDGDGRFVQSAYKLDDMYQKLGAMSAKSVTVFMDACFSGSKREDGMLASARGIAIRAKAGAPQGNMVVFSAATGDETAYPNNDEQHGMFTYYLLKKLQETKGDVTLQDLGDYITTNVRQQSIVKNGKSQTPTVTPSAEASTWQTWKLK